MVSAEKTGYKGTMSKPQIDEIVTSLGMPLRDVAKTLRAASHASQPHLKAPARMLPEPLRHLIKDTVRQADRLGSRWLDRTMPDSEQIARANTALQSGCDGLEGISNLTRVISFGLGEALERLDGKDWVIGDSRLALLLLNTRSNHADISESAAALMQTITSSHAVLSLRDLAPGSTDGFVSARTVATFAALLWVSLDRDKAQDEAALLLLCIDVARSSQDEVEAALASRTQLHVLFNRLSEII